MKQEQSSLDNREIKRPRTITGLVILFLIVSLFQLYRFSTVITQWAILKELPLSVSPLYLAGSGFLWGFCGLVLCWGIWTGKPWARSAALIISFVYTAFIWSDMIWIAEPDVLKTRWLINLIYSILGLSGIWIILNLRKNKTFFSNKPL
jgi:hypothetical protein